MACKDIEKQRSYNYRYYVAHREERNEGARKYYEIHREERRAYARNRYATHKKDPKKQQDYQRVWRAANSASRKKNMQSYYIANRARLLIRYRKNRLKTYGLTNQDYEKMLTSQGGTCAICQRVPKKISLHVDHNHSTGEVRGLLCYRCNTTVGFLENDVLAAKKLFKYIKYF